MTKRNKERKALRELRAMSTQDLLDWLTEEGVMSRWQNEGEDLAEFSLKQARRILYKRLGFKLPKG